MVRPGKTFLFSFLALGEELFKNMITVQVGYSRTEYHDDQ